MHFPAYLEIGSIKILLHSITEIVAIFIGFRYFLFLRKRKGDEINNNNRIWILIAAIFGALAGSRLIGGLEDPQAMMDAENKWLYFYQNKTVLGGFMGGLFAVEVVKKMIGEKQPSGDLFAYPMILALIIGRIGCFSMGIYEQTYGTASDLTWAMDLGDGVPRHPVALYEIFFLLGLWFAMKMTEKKYSLTQGARFKIFMIAYITFRLLLDFIKPHYTFTIGLSTIQLTCLLGLLYYLPYIVRPKQLANPVTS